MNVLGQKSEGATPAPVGPVPDGLDLRPLEASDHRRVMAVVDEWWGRSMGELLPRPFFSEFRDTSFVVEQGGEPVAFLVGVLSQTDPDEAHIHAVAVAPAWRGRGLGRLLYERFVEVARDQGRRRVRALTSPTNTASLAFHRRLGFAVEMPTKADGEEGRAELFLELPHPTSIDLDSANAYVAAAALRTPLSGRLITLEPLARRHQRELADAAVSSDWGLMPLDASTPAPFKRWLESMLAGNGNGDPRDPRAAFAVRRRDGRAIGSTSFQAVYPEHRRVEIGMTWYARSEWGRTVNVEAKLLMLTRAFALGFRRVEFKTDANNARSRRALEALPAQFEGVLRRHMLVRGGQRRDSAYYSVIDDDWPAVRANLERRLAKHQRRNEEGERTTSELSPRIEVRRHPERGGVVVVRSAYKSSLNYGSAVVLGHAHKLDIESEKRAALEAVVEHVVPEAAR
jgi:N-acetyltransferase